MRGEYEKFEKKYPNISKTDKGREVEKELVNIDVYLEGELKTLF